LWNNDSGEKMFAPEEKLRIRGKIKKTTILWNNDNGDKCLPQKKNYESVERFKKKKNSRRKLLI